MMTPRFFFIVGFCIFLGFYSSSCKKEYPKDIPEWLEDEIKWLKKHNCRCGTYCVDGIWEYSDGENTCFFIGQKPYPAEVYDYDGDWHCQYWDDEDEYGINGVGEPTCGGLGRVGSDDYQEVREVWRCD